MQMFRVRAPKSGAAPSIRSDPRWPERMDIAGLPPPQAVRREGSCKCRNRPADRGSLAPDRRSGDRDRDRPGCRAAGRCEKLGWLTDNNVRGLMGKPTRGVLTPMRGCGHGRASNATPSRASSSHRTAGAVARTAHRGTVAEPRFRGACPILLRAGRRRLNPSCRGSPRAVRSPRSP